MNAKIVPAVAAEKLVTRYGMAAVDSVVHNRWGRMVSLSGTSITHVAFEDALGRGLRILDAAAFALCQENHLPMLVFGMEGEGNITRALQGERIGTLVTAE